jgi:hypothetical protein
MIFSVIVLPITLSPLPSAAVGSSYMPWCIRVHDSYGIFDHTAMISFRVLGPGLFPGSPRPSTTYRDVTIVIDWKPPCAAK